MTTFEQALDEYGKAIQPNKPFPAILGAFIAETFQVSVPTNPAIAYVRHLDNTPTTAKHRGRVNLATTDQALPIALYYDEYGDLAIWGLEPTQAGAAIENDPNIIVPAHTHDGADIISGTVAAARLGLMTGDSGSGGAKGAVPAPGAGDAAAGKYLRASGAWDIPSGGSGSGSDAIYRELTGVAVANTTTPTSLLSSGVGSLLIPANLLLAGDVIRVHFSAFGGSKASSSGDITLAVLMNATPIALLGPVSMVDGNAGAFVTLDAEILFQTIGATATARAKVTLYCELFSTPFQVFWWGSTVDTTINQTLDIAVTFSVADPANTLDSTAGATYFEKL